MIIKSEDESELAKTFNSHYINIVKSTAGKNLMELGTLASRVSEKEIVATFTDRFKNHPNIVSTKNQFQPTAELNIKAATVDQINKIKSLKRQQDQTKFQSRL